MTPGGFGSYVLCVRIAKSGDMTSVRFYAGQGAWEDNISRENPEKLELLVQPMPQTTALMQAIRQLDGEGALTAFRDLFAKKRLPSGKASRGRHRACHRPQSLRGQIAAERRDRRSRDDPGHRHAGLARLDSDEVKPNLPAKRIHHRDRHPRDRSQCGVADASRDRNAHESCSITTIANLTWK